MEKYYLKNKAAVLFLISAIFCFGVYAQKPQAKRSFEISLAEDEKIETEIKSTGRFDSHTGMPVTLYGLNYEVPQGSPESMARFYLQNESKTLGIPKEDLQSLQHHATRTTNSGSVVRFRQYAGNYPVNKNEVTISISPQGKVVYVMSSFQKLEGFNSFPSVSEDRAYELAYNYLNVESDVLYKSNRLMVYNNTKVTRLANEVTILTNNPAGEWHVFVDAQTGEIFKVVDLNYYHSDKNKKKTSTDESVSSSNEYRRRVNGTGMVFDPDPLSSNMVAYGGGYVDGNDANTAQLEAAGVSVTLSDITQTGSTYSLVGPRAEIVDFDAPSTGLFTQNSSDFSFTRDEQGFEAVNIYYHIDFLMNYINNTLGCDIMPYHYSGGVQYDPHGWNGQDQSSYSSGTGQLRFGEGCVDDGEDSDVIHHELGHGLHDWVTAGGLSQVDGLSEGCGDYIAQSYNRSLGNWTSTDAQYNWVFNWDGHNECWGGRTTAHTATYPGGLVGQIHTDGQIWSTCLMGIWDQIGQQEMDKIFYEGLGMTSGTSSQNDAAVAVYQSAINLNYSESDINTIHASLTACGYTLPALPGPPVAALSADNEVICLDTNNTVNFMNETVQNTTSWSWSFEGGTPATSTDENPSVTYSATGTYDVTLTVTNSYGSDTITLTDYISVVSGDSCPTCETSASSTNLGISIPDGTGAFTPGSAVTHTINVPTDFIIDDINVNVDISHTFIRDLEITIIHPNGTDSVIVWDQTCVGENDLDVTFDDGAEAIVCDEPTAGTYNPDNPLSAFSGLSSAGDWTISIRDWYVGDLGTLNDWSLYICSEAGLSIEESSLEEFSIYPNPNNGTFTVKMNTVSNSDIDITVFDIRGRRVYNKTYNSSPDFNETIDLGNAQSGMYLLNVSDGEKTITKKLIVN